MGDEQPKSSAEIFAKLLLPSANDETPTTNEQIEQWLETFDGPISQAEVDTWMYRAKLALAYLQARAERAEAMLLKISIALSPETIDSEFINAVELEFPGLADQLQNYAGIWHDWRKEISPPPISAPPNPASGATR